MDKLGFCYRAATENDIQELCLLGEKFLGDYDKEIMAKLLRDFIQNDRGMIAIIEPNDQLKIVATALLFWYIEPAYQDKGVGKILLSQLETFVKNHRM